MKLEIDVEFVKSGRFIPATLTEPEEWPEYELSNVWIGSVDILSELSEEAQDAILEQLDD